MATASYLRSMGLAPGDWTQERVVDGLLQICWRGTLDGRPGWHWCIGTLDGQWLAGGWGLGSVRDRNRDIAQAMARVLASEAA